MEKILKNVGEMARQGDILAIVVDKKPAGLTEIARDNGRAVIEYGEVTGHAHAVCEPEAKLFQADDRKFLESCFAADAATKTVKQTHDEHGTINYAGDAVVEFRRQKTYDYATEMFRSVAD